MSKVNLYMLAQMALAREIPSGMEQAWKDRTGANPVREALKLEQQRHSTIRMAMISLSFLALSAMTTDMLTVDVPYSRLDSATAVVFYLHIIVMAVASLGLICAAGSRLFADRTGADDDITAFCVDLNNFVDWCCHMLKDDSYRKDWMTLLPIHLEEDATKILVRAAKQVRKTEKRDSGRGSDEWDHRSESAAKATMTLRYDTLKRLGLAAGGFGKYYTLADREIAEEDKKSEPAAT